MPGFDVLLTGFITFALVASILMPILANIGAACQFISIVLRLLGKALAGLDWAPVIEGAKGAFVLLKETLAAGWAELAAGGAGTLGVGTLFAAIGAGIALGFAGVALMIGTGLDKALAGAGNEAEAEKTFSAPTKEQEKIQAVSTKRVTINFATGVYALDENCKYIIDNEFVSIAKSYPRLRIRIEGNTDNVGVKDLNITLSKKRAQSVVDYLISRV
jgi:hypothetical protein